MPSAPTILASVAVILLIPSLNQQALAQCIDVDGSPVSARARRLFDENRKAITDANVEVGLPGRTVHNVYYPARLVYVTKSDRKGRFLVRVPRGKYVVMIRATGFNTYRYVLDTSASPKKVTTIQMTSSSKCNDLVPAN